MFEIDPEKRRGGAVGQIDAPGAVEADNPRRHPGQHSLGKLAALVELAIRVPQFALLALDLIGHAVERAAQRGQLVVLLPLGDADGEIAAADLLGRSYEAADRHRQLGSVMDPDCDRCDQEQQCHHHEDQGKLDLRAGSLTLQLLVLGGGALGFLHVVQDSGLDEAADKKVDVAELVEAHERPHTIIAVVGHDRHIALVGAAHRGIGDPLKTERE